MSDWREDNLASLFNRIKAGMPFNAPGFPVETRFGPLITINSYVPITSFDLPRRPSDDDLKRAAADIAAHLAPLIAANPALRQ